MYIEEVENYFCRKKGKSLILSPKDWLLVKKWADEGTPLAIVLKGIDTTFENNPSPKRINSIGYCEPEILSSWELCKENMIGSVRKTEQKDAPGFILDRVNEIIKTLSEKSKKGRRKNIYKHILSMFENMNNVLAESRQSLTFFEAEETFNRNQKEIALYLKERLNANEISEIEDKITNDLEPYKKRMPKKTYDETREQIFQKELLKKFSLTNTGLYD